MDLGIDNSIVLAFFFKTIFAFWPFILFSPIPWKRSRLSLKLFLTIWLILALIRVGLFVWSGEGLLIIPEPLNTLLFGLAGLALFGIWFIRGARTQPPFQENISPFDVPLHEVGSDDFEDHIAHLFRTLGHQVQKSGGPGDHGIDLIIQSKGGEKWIIQCKKWKGSVGEPIVRDLYGVMQHTSADRGAIVTTGTFSKPAIAWTKGKPIDLIDGKQLQKIRESALRNN